MLETLNSPAFTPNTARAQWHIFCRVIDNFGDIGVCWRLAQQLQQHNQQVHLWVDCLASFQKICPSVDASQSAQTLQDIVIYHWQESLPESGLQTLTQANAVIEAFGCELPTAVLEIMRAQPVQPLWLNLEYLSAEPWVEGMHGLPSPVHGMTKYFFFPGFTAQTGGLLWENELLKLPNTMQQSAQRQALFSELNLAPELSQLPLHISLFAYENPQLPALLDALSQHSEPVHLLVPQGRISEATAAWFGMSQLAVGSSHTRGALTLSTLPFMSQPMYDRLMACCQLNFVRGEESFVRAQMLGLPMLWHIYQQQEDTHLIKLDAFLQLYLAHHPEPLKQQLQQAFLSWSQGSSATPNWREILQQLPRWQALAQQWQAQQQGHGSLAQNLLQFMQARYNLPHF